MSIHALQFQTPDFEMRYLIPLLFVALVGCDSAAVVEAEPEVPSGPQTITYRGVSESFKGLLLVYNEMEHAKWYTEPEVTMPYFPGPKGITMAADSGMARVEILIDGELVSHREMTLPEDGSHIGTATHLETHLGWVSLFYLEQSERATVHMNAEPLAMEAPLNAGWVSLYGEFQVQGDTPSLLKMVIPDGAAMDVGVMIGESTFLFYEGQTAPGELELILP